MYTPRVKICCISSINEAQLAIKYGASALGLVSNMPSGPGVIKESLIQEIVSIIPPGISSFLLTSEQSVSSIINQQKFTKTNTIQIVDKLIEGNHTELKNALPGIKIVQVIHVNDEKSYDEALDVAPHIDALLLDSGNQKLKKKELGGTGRTHNWEISKKIVQNCNKPVFLAGGLNPENITKAITKVKPFGVDLCSGIRTNGLLDENKLKLFFENINFKSIKKYDKY